MKKRALLSAIALCFLASGCDSKKTAEPPKPTTAAVVPLPPAAPTAPAASANQDAKTATASAQVAQAQPEQKKQVALKPACKGGNHCKVEVAVTDGPGTSCTIKKDPDTLHVAKGSPEKITWKMANGSTWALDKIVFNSAGAPFKCAANGPHITCEDDNKETSPKQHPYKVHVKKGTVKCSTDPMIVNGAEDQN